MFGMCSRMEAVREEAEALAGQEHPLLGPPPGDAVVSPSMPFRLFMPTKVRHVDEHLSPRCVSTLVVHN